MTNSSPPAYKDRRKHPRIKYSIDIDWGETPACIHQGRITTLSVGGCFLQTPLAVAKGSPVFIRLLLAPDSERVMEGVVWGRVAYHLLEAGLGIEFKKLPSGYAEHIEDIVAFHLESEGDT